jgi:hypothetical protein
VTEKVKADRHLYLTADRTRVVEEGDPDSHTLWVSPGHSVPLEDAQRLGAVELMSHPRGSSVKQAPAAANKQAPAPSNKAR